MRVWLVESSIYYSFIASVTHRSVNDLGGTMDGSGSGRKLADDVVDIIRSRGGVAVANYGKSQMADGFFLMTTIEVHC